MTTTTTNKGDILRRIYKGQLLRAVERGAFTDIQVGEITLEQPELVSLLGEALAAAEERVERYRKGGAGWLADIEAPWAERLSRHLQFARQAHIWARI